ncbi:MAG: DUF4230 domain-containing protein [Marinomonas sp.]
MPEEKNNKLKDYPIKLGAVMLALPVAAFAAGYYVAPKEQLDEVVEQNGLLQTNTAKVLATTVESLRAENSLIVWSYKGSAKVKARQEDWLLLEGTQELIVPAVVSYRLDLNKLTLADVSYNEKAKLVTVKLPKLGLGDIAFQPEAATKINGGLLTFKDDTVQALTKLNYKQARRAMTAQAQQKTMVEQAQAQAAKNVAKLFEIPLRIAGHPDVKVVATFD